MATVERKKDTDEKHSLSSFDKRKVQSVTFGARQLDRKKYKVVNHGIVSPSAENARISAGHEARAPLEHEEKVDGNISFKNNFAKPDSYNYTHQRNAVNNADTGTSDISPEMAQRMKRAAFLASNGTVDAVKSIGNAVSGSSSVSSAIPDVATTLATVEAKKFVAKIMKGESSEKDRKFVDEHKAAGKTKYVDSNKEGFKVEHRISEDEHIAENMSREERRNFLHNKRVAEKQKNLYADRMKTERKKSRKKCFLISTRTIPSLFPIPQRVRESVM